MKGKHGSVLDTYRLNYEEIKDGRPKISKWPRNLWVGVASRIAHRLSAGGLRNTHNIIRKELMKHKAPIPIAEFYGPGLLLGKVRVRGVK